MSECYEYGISPTFLKCLRTLSLAGFFAVTNTLLAQTDTTTHGYPVTPFSLTHPITGVFSEFRNTLTSDHFHNGVDIPEPDGSPVYPVYNGTVTAIGAVAQNGDNAYVRVQYVVSGLTKSDAYVHITPNPALVVGDPVTAYSTVLGNIRTGLGHVHFTHGLSPYMNGIRPVGGLTPYIDNYPPNIVSVRFFVDETNTELTGGRVSGSVDIRAHIAETSAADPGGISSSTTNNGTYIAGYRILSADTASVVYEPPDQGVRYKFDRMPSDTYVARVFATGSDLSTHIYTLTNGDGASYINTSRIVNNSFWITGSLPVGNYVVMVFAEDTRGLRDTVYVPVEVTRQDFVAPTPPRIQSVMNDSTNRITIRWYPNTEADLRGYRLYFSLNGTTWTLKDGEAVLGPGRASISYDNVLSGTIFFRLAAIDSAAPANVSTFSDVYGVRLNSSPTNALIVDGFDRIEASGSYHALDHPFAMTHGQSMPHDFNTCSNEAVIEGLVSLQNYPIVIWMFGDESTADETFDINEQVLVKAYLQNGGKLFVSGSEIAWDLDRPSGPAQPDRDFLHDYLKARYAGDDANEYTVAGANGTVFAGVSLRYGVIGEGSPYDEDYPDYLTPEPGASILLHYGSTSNPAYAGIGFTGLFPGGTQPGGVVYLGFPFETITTKATRDTVMRRVYQYFDLLTGLDGDGTLTNQPQEYRLMQNYPNPFNPSTSIKFQTSNTNFVSLKVYDMLGREVTTLVSDQKPAGTYEVRFDATGLASGIYYYRITAGGFSDVKKMVLVK